jgi:hypothetical protein
MIRLIIWNENENEKMEQIHIYAKALLPMIEDHHHHYCYLLMCHYPKIDGAHWAFDAWPMKEFGP